MATAPNSKSTPTSLMPVYVGTMLLSASLLFLVQPMFARMALPLLGGTPAVWAIAMCFFQGVLLGGYCYAHLLKKFLAPSHAVILHIILMALAWFFLPVNLPPSAVPAGGSTAGLWLIGLMAKSIGYPFFFLSATAPLLQSWFARTTHQDAANPYFLYSASNIGSLSSLIAYPFIVEPLLGLHNQALFWSVGFGLLAVAIAVSGYMMLKNLAPARIVGFAEAPSFVTWKNRLWWIFMSFIPSALLVAWTNHITTDIASAPFLWLPPLVLFLLTFVLVFRDKSLVPVGLARVIQLASLPVAFVVQFALPLWLAVPVMIIGALSFFATAVICHRQLYESRPDASHLTEFYMLMSLGGVLGGLFVSLIAPLVFNKVLEYPILLIAGIAASNEVLADEKLRALIRKPIVPAVVFIALLALVAFTAKNGGSHLLFTVRTLEIAFFGACAAAMILCRQNALATLSILMVGLISFTGQPQERIALRSYFGVLTVADNGAEGPYRLLTHGTTMHGAERLSELTPDYKDKPHPLTYYSEQGGMARALLSTQERLGGQAAIVRVVGLGTGSLACYAKPGEDWAYYEIDRDVIKVAKDPNQFTFLSSCAPNMRMIEGDARITLQNETIEKADYFLVDAFSSDSIPVHLITTEAIQLYLSHLKDDGLLVIHVTNRYMDLVPVVAANMAAIDKSLQGRVIDFVPPTKNDVNAMHSIAIVISKNQASLELLDKAGGTAPLLAQAGVEKWTDDFANLPSAILRRIAISKY
jgi:SAM-dependent methyltransferase